MLKDHVSRANFVSETMEKYGFGKRNLEGKTVPHKNDYTKPDIPIEVITHERFKDQGRQHVINSLKESTS